MGEGPRYSPVPSCNLCGSGPEEWKIVFPLNAKQALVRCSNCTLLFNNKQRIDFENVYPDEYFDANENIQSGGGFYEYSSLDIAIRRMYRFAHDFIMANSKEAAAVKILDIGCSFGFFLKQFKGEKRFQTVGIELNKLAAKHAELHTSRVYGIPFEEFIGEADFNYITSFEVIEHVLNPLSFMKKVRGMLSPGGYAVLATPDAGSLYFKILGRRWPAIHPDVHNHYFSEDTIRRLAYESGFAVVRIERSYLLWYDVFHIRKRLAEMFSEVGWFFRLFSILDKYVIPFPNGCDLRIILRKLG
jgi:2-polyprenyl-3-methyl-5-hydroxy-6-metoxy-1,4-benzoquinol methylase